MKTTWISKLPDYDQYAFLCSETGSLPRKNYYIAFLQETINPVTLTWSFMKENNAFDKPA